MKPFLGDSLIMSSFPHSPSSYMEHQHIPHPQQSQQQQTGNMGVPEEVQHRVLSMEGIEVSPFQDGHDLPQVIQHHQYDANHQGIAAPAAAASPYSQQPASPYTIPQRISGGSYQHPAPDAAVHNNHPSPGYFAPGKTDTAAPGATAYNEKNPSAYAALPDREGLEPSKRKKNKKKWIIIIGIIALIVIIGAVVGGIVGSQKKDNNEPKAMSGTSTGSADASTSSSSPEPSSSGSPLPQGNATESGSGSGEVNALPMSSSKNSACHGGICTPILKTVSWKGKQFVFGLSAKKALMVQSGNGKTWDGSWRTLGGSFKFPPTIVSWGPGRIDVMGVQDDTHMYWKTFKDGAWGSEWVSMGGDFISAPSATCWGPGRIDIFGEGTDYALWHNYFPSVSDSTTWGGWESLSGVIQGGPSAVAWGENRLDIFARGTDNALWHKFWNGKWSGWESQGGVIVAEPIVVSSAANTLDIFVLGLGNTVCWKGFHSAWFDWQCLGNASYESLPSPVVLKNDRVDVIAVGSDDHLYHRSMSGTTWSTEWDDLGGPANSAPVALAGSDGKTDVFVVGMDGKLYSSTYSSTAFSWSNSKGWDSFGGKFSSVV